MSEKHDAPSGPDLAAGVGIARIPATGALAGHVGDEPVMLSRVDGVPVAVGAKCTHYGGPLAKGLFRDGTVRCPLHHACFDLRSGNARAAPAFAPLRRYRVECVGAQVFVREPLAPDPPVAAAIAESAPGRIVIIGGGAAAFGAAHRLRELGFGGALSLLSADDSAPYDRPNLSKDYLAGTAPEDWMPLRGGDFYADRRIDLRLRCEVTALDTAQRVVTTRAGESFRYDALLIATGAEPVRLDLPGFDRANVFTLRSMADARSIIAEARKGRSVALVGAGFIGLEAAAALRTRGLDVHVIARGRVPLEHAVGADVGGFLARLHEEHGVVFHFDRSPTRFDGSVLALDDGSEIGADLVLAAVGVRPRIALARSAGLALDDGIVVSANLETSVRGVFAAGDVARYRAGSGTRRIEHWVVAERQGQVAAENLLGRQRVFDDVPFFWSSQYGVQLRHVGHAARWDRTSVDGSLDAGDFTVRYFERGRLVAAAAIGRDHEILEIGEQLRDR
jgi:NADPH-dependent 2,4-dienoyl-CoA reductase/sulfur reductase-like enzyme/nitrite reductase/ring-hydroxylating ferredoxin subunit